MFIGKYEHNLDAKGRIVIPGKLRNELHTSFILTRGLDSCLTIYSLEQWEKIFIEINKLPTTKKAARQYIRVLTSSACECTLDNQGRILIPTNLATPVGIKKECIIVGANDHIEIWDKEAWEEYINIADEGFEEIAENLSDLIKDE